MQPQVQSLDEILAGLETAYAPMRDIYGKQQAMIPQKFDNIRTGLEGTRVKQFDKIAGSAGRAGMSWGGFTQNEQADFLADKFLPGMQQTYVQQSEEGLGLQKSLAQLDAEKRLQGMGTQEKQKNALSAFQEAERDRAYRAEQARIEREATARENALNRQASASERAGARADAKGPTLKKNSRGGWEVSDSNMDLAGYARATGADLISLLEQGDGQDKKAAKYYKDNIRLGRGETYAMERLRNYDRRSAFYRGG